MDPLELEFTVACDAARAFSLWAEQTTRWWPHGHSVSTEAGLTEPHPGGRIYERTPACASSIAAGSGSAPFGEERRGRNRLGWAGVTEHYRRVADA